MSCVFALSVVGFMTAHETDILYMRNYLEEITKNKYNQGGLTLKDLKPDTFESNEKSKLSFRQWSTSSRRGSNGLTKISKRC